MSKKEIVFNQNQKITNSLGGWEGFENQQLNFNINFLNQQFTESDVRQVNNIKKFITIYPKSKYSILFDYLVATNGLFRKIVETNAYRAFNVTPVFVQVKTNGKQLKKSNIIPVEVFEYFTDYINTSLDSNLHSIEHEKTRAVIEAQKLGGSFLVLCVNKEGDKLEEPLPIDKPELLHKDTLCGNIYVQTASLVNNNRYEIKEKLGLDNFSNYFNEIGKEQVGRIENSEKAKELHELLEQDKEAEQTLYDLWNDKEVNIVELLLSNGRRMRVHKSRIITYTSTNTPISQISNKLNGFGYSILEQCLDSVLSYQSLLLDLVDASRRAILFKLVPQGHPETPGMGELEHKTAEQYQMQQQALDKLADYNLNRSIFMAPKGYDLTSTSTDFKGLVEAVEQTLKNIAVQTCYSKQDLEGEGSSGFSSGKDMSEQTERHIDYLRTYFKPKNEFLYKIIFANQINVSQYGYNTIHTISLQYNNVRQESAEDRNNRIRLAKEILESLKDRGAINEKQLLDAVNDLGILENKIDYEEAKVEFDNETNNINNI